MGSNLTMNVMTELILVRHGETDWNRELRFQGQVDVPLNAMGLLQAQRLAERLAGEQIHHAEVSDLTRTRQTAEPTERALGLQARVDAGLREQNFGQVDGWSVDEIQSREPEAWSRWKRFDPDVGMPGGETTREFHARVMAALARIAAQHAARRVLVVTHGGVLDMVYRTARSLGLQGPRQSAIPNAGISRVRMVGDSIEILEWADVRHLDDLPAQPVYDQQRYTGSDASPSAA